MKKSKTKTIANLSASRLWSIDRQWLRADHLHIAFHEEEIRRMGKKKQKVIGDTSYFISKEGSYLYLWYALLFSALEGLEQSGVELNILNNYAAILYKELKKFRDSIFHTPSSYWDKRFVRLFKDHETNNESRIEKLHRELGLKLQKEIRKRKKKGEKLLFLDQ